MRAAVVVALLVVALPAAAQPADAPDGFDHIVHHGRVISRAQPPPPCSRCHQVARGGRLIGSPGHAACFGDCHGPPPRARSGRPYKIDSAARRLCTACHRPAQITRLERRGGERIRSSFPPYGIDREFALTMSHAAHARVERGCRACHAAPAEPGAVTLDQLRARERRARAAAPHRRCAGCHDQRKPGGIGIDSCTACHASQVGPTLAPRREPGAYPVRSRFSHRRHLARMPRAAAGACATCHAGVLAQTGERVPTPRKEHCRSCHDGKRAFSMVETACRRCHGPPEREGPSPSLTRARFSHRAHIATGRGLTCATCHALDPRGAPVTALRGHAPCSDAACHAADFAAAAPATCGVCHVRAEPWRELHDDPTPAELTEFGVDFSHRTHLGGRASAPCTSCHRLAQSSGRFEPSPGHAACTGGGCHAPARGASPPLSRCESCHALGSAERREQLARGRRWSVRQRFTHEPHRTEPAGATRPLPCVECHTAALTSTSNTDMTTPRKASCARCHDGGAAFKLTGHTCSRCHVTPISTPTGSRSGMGQSAPP